MFIREKKFKARNKTYLQIVENEWVNGHVKQKIVLSLGCLQALKENGDLLRLAKSLLKYCEQETLDITQMEEERRIHWGIPKIIERLWHTFDFTAILKKCCQNRAIKSDLYRTIRLMLSDRFLCPCSKLKSYEKQDKYWKSEVELHQLYTTLDYLAEFKDQIEKELFERNVNLFNMQVNVVFYDVTTFHFESETPDELRDFGFSKNGKYQEVQVVLGLLVDLEGRPVGFDLFPGNLYEGHTLKNAIEKLKRRFAIEKLIVVADRGMMSADNLLAIRSSGYEYIISTRLKKLPEAIQEKVLDLNSYEPMPASPDAEDEGKIKYKLYAHEDVFAQVRSALTTGQPPEAVYRELRKVTKQVSDAQLKKTIRAFRKQPFTEENRQSLLREITHYCSQRLILTWSEKRANRDKAKRDLLVSKAQELVNNPPDSFSHRGPRRYLRTDARHVSIFEARIQEDEKWDGFYGVYTNNQDLNWQLVLEHYRMLWRIEESFRILKSHFQTRPIFHWTPRRIEGHMVLCFIAFLSERFLELELRKRQIVYSPDKIKEAITCMQASLVNVKEQKFYLTANLNALAREILHLFKIKAPAKVVPAAQFEKEYLLSDQEKSASQEQIETQQNSLS